MQVIHIEPRFKIGQLVYRCMHGNLKESEVTRISIDRDGVQYRVDSSWHKEDEFGFTKKEAVKKAESKIINTANSEILKARRSLKEQTCKNT